jgi:predicted transcriptional regulator
MIAKLSEEQRAALTGHEGPLPVEDDETRQVFFLVDSQMFEALRREADRAAIREGIDDMEAGRVLTLEELDRRIRAKIAVTTPS